MNGNVDPPGGSNVNCINNAAAQQRPIQDYKLIKDPFLVKVPQKVYRYNGIVPNDPQSYPPVIPKDPRQQNPLRLKLRMEIIELPVPR